MALTEEDLEPRRPTLGAPNLELMSIDGLHDYITSLEAEIARTREVISRKQAAREGAESFFRKK